MAASSPRQAAPGTCRLCGEAIDRSKATVHLKRCRGQALDSVTVRVGPMPIYDLEITDRYRKQYWLRVELPGDAALAYLDGFLREIWCECCGHLSGFQIHGANYSYDDPYGMQLGQPMSCAIGEVVEKGDRFGYLYDYGTPTELQLRVVDVRLASPLSATVKLLARNDPPVIRCEVCGAPAVKVCGECIWEGEGYLCGKHAARHRCGQDYLLPLPNSPRAGMCGYTGPADDPSGFEGDELLAEAALPDDLRDAYDRVDDLCARFTALHIFPDGYHGLARLLLLVAEREPERFLEDDPRLLAAALLMASAPVAGLLDSAEGGPISALQVPSLMRTDAERSAELAARITAMMDGIGPEACPAGANLPGLILIEGGPE